MGLQHAGWVWGWVGGREQGWTGVRGVPCVQERLNVQSGGATHTIRSACARPCADPPPTHETPRPPASGDAWRETWREVIGFDAKSSQPTVERTAHKWARNGQVRTSQSGGGGGGGGTHAQPARRTASLPACLPACLLACPPAPDTRPPVLARCPPLPGRATSGRRSGMRPTGQVSGVGRGWGGGAASCASASRAGGGAGGRVRALRALHSPPPLHTHPIPPPSPLAFQAAAPTSGQTSGHARGGTCGTSGGGRTMTGGVSSGWG